MNNSKLFRIFLSLLVSSIAFDSFAQCDSRISILEKGVHNASKTGYIKLEVDSKHDYEVKLLQVTADMNNEMAVRQHSRLNGKVIEFNNLQTDKLYRISVEFKSEGRPVCLNRKTDIIEFPK